MFNGCQNIETVQVHAKVGFLLLGEHPEDLPAGSAPINTAIGQSLGKHCIDDLLSEQQFSALGVGNDVGNRGSC